MNGEIAHHHGSNEGKGNRPHVRIFRGSTQKVKLHASNDLGRGQKGTAPQGPTVG